IDSENDDPSFQMSLNKKGFFTREARPSEGSWNEWKQHYSSDFHPEADKLTEKRNIKLIGGATGEFDFDGSENVELNIVVDPKEHVHDNLADTAYIENLLSTTLRNHGLIEDFDLATTTGLYSTGSHCLNSPILDLEPAEGEELVLSDTIGSLMVDSFVMSEGSQIIKQAFFSEDETTYHRSYNSIKRVWTNWVQIYDTKFKPTADKLTSPVRINGVLFDGSRDIDISVITEHTHKASEITSGIFPLSRGGIGVDGNTLAGFIKRDKFTNVFTSSMTVDWSEIVNVPPGLGEPAPIIPLDIPDASLTTKGIVKLSETYNNSISEAAVPKMVTLVKDAFEAHHHNLQYSKLLHRHEWEEIDNKQKADFYNFGISK
ncbi:MAG: hypothetical protein ACRC5T_10985, partial [Cetobacterium sp.]